MKHSRLTLTLCLSAIFSLIFVQLPITSHAGTDMPVISPQIVGNSKKMARDHDGTLSAKVSDFDGDGKADLAVFRPSNSTWYLKDSSTGAYRQYSFGVSTDSLVPSDFDGDGKTDIAVFRGSTAQWYILKSSDGMVNNVSWGRSGDLAQAGDFNGDGNADYIAIRNSPDGVALYIGSLSNSSTLQPLVEPVTIIILIVIFVLIPLAASMTANHDGDNKPDITLWNGGNWRWVGSLDGSVHSATWGMTGDNPLVGDFDGDNKTDLAVFRPSQSAWYILNSSNNSNTAIQFGTAGDIPVPADYDGDGKTDVAVFRPGTGNWHILQSSNGLLRSEQFGQNGDRPIPAEYFR